MFARLTFIKLSAENTDHVKKIFNEEIVPVVRSQKGNLGCWLLEPTNAYDDYISLTEWTSSSEAEAYHSSGTYQTLIDKVKTYFSAKPALKTYNVAESNISVTATH